MQFDISLYGILDPEHCLGRSLPELADLAVEGGCTILQYRDKVNDELTQCDNVTAILDAVHGRVPVLMNDKVHVAQAAKAEGVHLGQNDMSVAKARRILGKEAIIGLTVKSVEDSKCAIETDCNYICIGGVFETSSKKNTQAIGIAGWQEIADVFRQAKPISPVGAIAGITPAKTKELFFAGADGVAVISAIFEQKDVLGATKAFQDAIIEGRAGYV